MTYRNLLEVLKSMTASQLDCHVLVKMEDGKYLPCHEVEVELKETEDALFRWDLPFGNPLIMQEREKSLPYSDETRKGYGQCVKNMPVEEFLGIGFVPPNADKNKVIESLENEMHYRGLDSFRKPLL